MAIYRVFAVITRHWRRKQSLVKIDYLQVAACECCAVERGSFRCLRHTETERCRETFPAGNCQSSSDRSCRSSWIQSREIDGRENESADRRVASSARRCLARRSGRAPRGGSWWRISFAAFWCFCYGTRITYVLAIIARRKSLHEKKRKWKDWLRCKSAIHNNLIAPCIA